MAAVRIDLSPPPQDDVVALRIYESTAGSSGPYVQIERTTTVGVYPSYISHFTTTLATSATSWFKIAWEYQGGVVGPQSQGVQAGQGPTLIGRVIERAMQRDPTLNEGIVAQEAEGVIESFFGKDPYDPTLTYTYTQLNGLVLMTLYRAQLVRFLQSATASDVDSFTIGIVSAKSGTSTATITKSEQALARLLSLAQQELGVGTSLILQLAEPSYSVGLTSYDHSRLIGWVGLE